jgi:sporulation protein YlmC with PRC-barrel domain
MIAEEIRLRSDLIGVLVVTRDTGKKLGVVSQLWVDIDQQDVVALSLRPNLLYGTPQTMLLDSICQIGDVILVENEDVIEDLDVETYSSLMNCEVVTETGDLLGKVRGYKFDIDSGKLTSLIIASLGLPQIPDQVVSTYELPIEEVVSSGPDRLIVFEGSEQRLVQVTVGVLERLGIGRSPWDREDEDAYVAPARIENRLGTGLKTPIATPIREREPVMEQAWDDDNWGEPEPRQKYQEQRVQPLYYGDDDNEEDNWSEAVSQDRYTRYPKDEYTDDYDDQYDDAPSVSLVQGDDDLERDAWEDEATSYETPKVNIPEKTREPEYEE